MKEIKRFIKSNIELSELVDFCNENGLYDFSNKSVKKHSEKVCYYANQIMGYNVKADTQIVLIASLLHDIGKSRKCLDFYKKNRSFDYFIISHNFNKKKVRKVHHDRIGKEFIANKKSLLNNYLRNHLEISDEIIIRISEAVEHHNDYSFENTENSIVFCADKIAHIANGKKTNANKAKIECCTFDNIKKESFIIIDDVLNC